ncbi:peptidyl-prolyl cis-trans isomerase [Prosthecobacter sp.]|uniref:peptidylprolyl isomerase n=1 Tax=Prosthecobacter sp. TaxID=1965333 RepID=UPI002489CEAE|nr:peptidyl-prolyl cis-trans isomerase [Prosthecobacter sp.]MDI1314087.1 peptidyl-prolyl cis-trans isomerase [Prosthecobacter sp.]
MLEFFRRHRGAFLITLTASIIISMFYYGVSQTAANPDKKLLPTDVALTVSGKDYSVADVQRAQRSVEFSQYYLQSYEMASILRIIPSSGGLDSFANLFVARQLMEDLGIRPSNEEARAALEKLPALQNNGKFDVSRGQMLEQLASSMGFDSEALLDIMKDSIGLRKLQDLVTKSYTASPLAAEKQYASSYQTVKGGKITFETEAFKKTATVTDDEIKKYYEENKENYKTVEKRAVSYVFFEKAKDLDKKPLEERQKAESAVVERVNAFNALTTDQKSRKTFAEAAAATKEKVETVPAFAQGSPPEALKTENNLLDLIFARPKDSTSPAEAVEGDKGWYVFDVTKIEEPKQQTLAEVTAKIKEVLVGQKADEARTKAVNEARLALIEGLKSGKKIDELVKAQKLTLESLPDIDTANPPTEVPNSFLIGQEAAKTAVGSISHAVDFDKGTLLIYVSAKELRKRPDAVELRKNQVESLSDQERMSLFQAWFKKQHEAARIVIAKLG